MTVFADVVDAVHVRMNSPTVKKLIGRKALSLHDQQRRIVWIRAVSDYVPPENAGGKVVTDTRHRQVYTLEQAFEAHIYAENEDVLDQIVGNVVASMHLVLGPNIQRLRQDPQTQTEEPQVGKGHVVRGEKILLTGIWKLPQTDEIATLVIVEDQDHTCLLNDEPSS
jgi:hypothetical protein